VTGFMFPATHILPSHIVGGVSLVVLAAALLELYRYRLAGIWRSTYIASAMIALYLNVFVLIAQAFQKVPLLQHLAPIQSEAPFLVVQVIVLLLFVALGTAAAVRFRPNLGSLRPHTAI
jgi:hypothetical protein